MFHGAPHSLPALALVAGLAAPLAAQSLDDLGELADEELQQLAEDTIVITAPRAEEPLTSSRAKVTVVDAEQLARTGERSLPRAIGQAAGIWIQESNLGGGSPILRGLFGNQVLIVLDGVRLNDSTTRFGPNQILNTIDPSIVERVEIVRGSHSVLYGSDAIGGVLLIWTRSREAAGSLRRQGLGGRAAASYDTATEGYRGSLEVSNSNDEAAWLGIIAREDWGDLRAGGGEVQEDTGYSGNSYFGSLHFDLGERKTLRASAMVNSTYDVPRTFQTVAGFGQDQPRFERYDFSLQRREVALLTYDDGAPVIADRMQVRLSARRYTEQRDRIPTGGDTRSFTETTVETLGLGVDWIKQLGGHRLTFGLDAEHDEVGSLGRDTDLVSGVTLDAAGEFPEGSQYDRYGVFVQDEISSLDPWLFTLGMRWSAFDFGFDQPGAGRESGSFQDLTASAVAARDLSETVRMTGTLAQGFQAPNLEDLANDGDFAGGVELANPDLDPARSLMAELALDVERPTWSLTTALFWTQIDDYLGRRLIDEGDPGVSGDETWMRANAGEVELYGVELGGRYALGGERSPWAIEGVAAWVRGRQYDDTLDPSTGERPFDGVELRRVPPLNGRLSLLWQRFGRPQLEGLDEARFSLVWATEQDQLGPGDLSDPRIDPEGTDGWAIWNLDLSGPLGEGVRWNLSLVNLLDENYRMHGSAIDGPGRSVVIGFEASF